MKLTKKLLRKTKNQNYVSFCDIFLKLTCINFKTKIIIIIIIKKYKITSYFLKMTNLWNNYYTTKTLENIIKYVYVWCNALLRL